MGDIENAPGRTMENATVGVPYPEYQRLIEAADKLDKLEAAGVDNWEGYGEAMCDESL